MASGFGRNSGFVNTESVNYLPLRQYEKLAFFMIKYRKDTDGIVTLTFDMKDSSVNLMNHALGSLLLPVL